MKLQRLQLARPIISFDLETTGLDIANDRVVEICCVKIHTSGEREVRTTRLNPGRPIAPQATAVHGITDADVATAPRFEAASRELHAFFAGCDLTGFNIEHFDLPLLANEFGRCGLGFPAADARVIDSFRIFTMREPRDLSAALRFYCNRELTEAHHAEADALAAADVLLAQVDRYSDLPVDVPSLHAVCRPPEWLDGTGKIQWGEDGAFINFGKHKGKTLAFLSDNDPGYLRWMCDGKFPPDTIEIVRRALNGILPEIPEALRPIATTTTLETATVTIATAVTTAAQTQTPKTAPAPTAKADNASKAVPSTAAAATDTSKPAATLPAAAAPSIAVVTEVVRTEVVVTSVVEKRVNERARPTSEPPQLGLFGGIR